MRKGARSGTDFTCVVCGKSFYRLPSQILRGATKTCSRACQGQLFSGPGNPFWQRQHSDESKQVMAEAHKDKGLGNRYASREWTIEERMQRAEIGKRIWREQRQKMLDAHARGQQKRAHKPPELYRHRINFTPMQRREWKEAACIWCGSTDALVLDHIVPIFMGGGRYRENAQTLCNLCNLWKLWHVELPMWQSLQAKQGAMVSANP